MSTSYENSASDELPPIPFGFSEKDIKGFEAVWAEHYGRFDKSNKVLARFFYCLGKYDARHKR